MPIFATTAGRWGTPPPADGAPVSGQGGPAGTVEGGTVAGVAPGVVWCLDTTTPAAPPPPTTTTAAAAPHHNQRRRRAWRWARRLDREVGAMA
ncbi:MAG: hypothetical protein ACYDA2_10950 [Acidimicrobiales bacterium]